MYAGQVLITEPSHLLAYWPLWEAEGDVAHDISGNGRDGAYTGVTLGQAGIGDGRTCPYFDGTSDCVNVYSDSLRDAFDGSEGTAMIWARVANAGVWTDGTSRYMARFFVDNDNVVRPFIRSSTNNQLSSRYCAGGVSKDQALLLGPSTGWHCFVVTWSASLDEVRHFADGGQIGATANGLGVWAGNLSPNGTLIGAGWITPTGPWHGYLAHGAMWGKALTPAQVASLAVRINIVASVQSRTFTAMVEGP